MTHIYKDSKINKKDINFNNKNKEKNIDQNKVIQEIKIIGVKA